MVTSIVFLKKVAQNDNASIGAPSSSCMQYYVDAFAGTRNGTRFTSNVKQVQALTDATARTSDTEPSQGRPKRTSSYEEIAVGSTLRTFLLYVPET